jgi:hypothetical protein
MSYCDSLQDQQDIINIYKYFTTINGRWGSILDAQLVALCFGMTVCVWKLRTQKVVKQISKRSTATKVEYEADKLVMTNCFRPSAPFINPSTHQVIHLYATSHKGPKFDKETGRVEEVNHFDLLITPSKRQQLLFDGPSKQYWDLPMLQSKFVHSKRLEETYKEWSQVIYTARLEFSAYSKEKCDKDAAFSAENDKEAQSKPKSVTPLDKQRDSSIERPKFPPERTIPRYVELGESLLVSPLK